MPATLNALLYDIALTAYILAAAASIGSLLGRRDQLGWIALLLIQVLARLLNQALTS